ncbi:hypothetical protein BVRB_1g011020 isoform C [Beta vulgaris subsp. vulgaris]|nr:hypothetical protein BVRB_1g011020 isoform C [Beta vulgaris subsp. vulgaris]
MEKICQTCGVEGFSSSLIYCTECWNTVEHIYCLGLSFEDICEDFSWTCDSCKSIGELLRKMISYGYKSDETAKISSSGHSRASNISLPSGSAIPVVGPIWRGTLNTIGSFCGCLKGMEAFIPKTSYPNVIKIVRSMQPSLYFYMKERRSMWPKNFDELGAIECNIGLYIFPEFSRSETDYNNLVEYMVSNDLAMTAKMGNLELMIFTSLDIAALEKQTIKGRYYLWGTFEEKECRENPSKCYKPSADRSIGRGSRAVSCPKKPSISSRIPSIIQSGPKSKPRKATANTSSLLGFPHIPALRPGCKRARSKRGKEKTALPTNNQETVLLHQTFDKPSKAETCMTVEAIHREECLTQVPAEIQTSKTSTVDEVPAIILGEQNIARLLNDIIDSSDDNSDKKAFEVNDISNDQDPGGTASPLVASAKVISENAALSMRDVSCSSSPANLLNAEDAVEETIPDKPVRQVIFCNQDFDLSPALLNLVSECRKDVEDRLIEREMEAEQSNLEDGLMPLAVFLPNQILESANLHPQDTNVSPAADPENHTSLIPLFGYEEDSEVHEPNPLINAETDRCSDGEPVCHQNSMSEKVLDVNKASTNDDHPETHLEKDSCMTPIIDLEEEQSGASICPSTASTTALKLNAEETSISGSKNYRKASEMTTPASVLEMADDYHEASSNCVGKQVGRYHIKADLAPILAKILAKYGDIALDCSIDPEVPLENMCKAVKELETVGLSGLRHHHVSRLKNVLQLADALGIDIQWLQKRCDHLEKLASHLSQYPTLMIDLAKCKEDIQYKEEKLSLKRGMVEKLQDEMKSLEEEFESMKEYTEKLDCAVQSIKSISGSFHGRSLVFD